MFSLICAWINGWVNNHEAADLRRHRAHYDVILVCCWYRHCISVVLARGFPRRCMKLRDDILGDITRTDIHGYVYFQVRTYIYHVELNADIHILIHLSFIRDCQSELYQHLAICKLLTHWKLSMLCSTNVCLDIVWIWIRFGYGFQGQTVIISCGWCAERTPYYTENGNMDNRKLIYPSIRPTRHINRGHFM